ncbi:MAG: hypothetical protein IT287_05520 [Bdellovibrionaceae bacterium]|nr:hypothetical protein [Pseudobdellovibrionaceae bacterium]
MACLWLSAKLLVKSLIVSTVVLTTLHLSSFFILNTRSYKTWLKEAPDLYNQWNWAANLEPHPYFAYSDAQKNQNLPLEKKADEFTIAILGGSLAQSIGDFLLQSEKSTDNNYLQKIAEFIPKNKKLKILNLGLGAYQQPLQSLQFFLYAQSIDAVISIEGFNELFVNRKACAPIGWPTQFVKNSKDWENNFYVIALKHTRSLFNKVYQLPQQSIFTDRIHKTLFYILGKPLSILMTHIEEKTDKEISAESCKKYGDANGEHHRFFVWDKYIQKMHVLSATYKIPMLLIFQPNLHMQKSKPLSEQELLWTKNVPSTAIKSREYYYAKSELLLKKNLYKNFYDYTFIFKDHPETIYSDSCCHINDLGKTIFIEQLIKDLESAIKRI